MPWNEHELHELPRVMQVGQTVIYMRDGEGFTVDPECYGPVVAAWKAGKTFIDVFDLYGDALTVKLAEVSGVCRRTTRGIQKLYKDQQLEYAMRRRDRLPDGGE